MIGFYKVFIVKVTVTENSFAWNIQRDELSQSWNFGAFIFWALWNILITSAKKREKVSIAVTTSNLVLCSLLGGT